MKSVAVSGTAPSKAAATPPQRPCPMTAIDRTPRASTANSSAALAAWLPLSGAYTGTSAATLRTTNSSPGLASNTVSGPDRESEQATIIVRGR